MSALGIEGGEAAGASVPFNVIRNDNIEMGNEETVMNKKRKAYWLISVAGKLPGKLYLEE